MSFLEDLSSCLVAHISKPELQQTNSTMVVNYAWAVLVAMEMTNRKGGRVVVLFEKSTDLLGMSNLSRLKNDF